MNLLQPGPTTFELQFNIAGIPVRVHPLFWLVALFVSGGLNSVGVIIILGLLAVFVSILVHELGHAFTMQFYGERARVVLYWLGGLAISGGDVWDLGYATQRRTPQQQIVISAAGPAAGFVLAALVAGLVYALRGQVVAMGSPIPFFYVAFDGDTRPSDIAILTLQILLNINIFWGLLNLLPVYPLDGGQIARQMFVLNNPYEGITKSLWLSLVVAAAVAVFGLTRSDMWMTMMFGSMAFGSWQMLQNAGHGGRPW
jgi:Zn-dependent protease